MRKNKPIFVLVLFLTTITYSQINERVLNGIIVSDSLSKSKIHIINKTIQKGTISNEDGTFQIPAKVLDTLIFSGIQYKVLYKIVSKEDLQKLQVIIKMKPQLNELDEVLIKHESITKRLNLPNADKKPKTKLEARIDGHSKASNPIVVLDALLIGPLLNKKGGLNNLYYMFSGERKKDRKLQQLLHEDSIKERNRETIENIKKFFEKDFFIYTLKIDAKKIDDFIDYCIPKNIITLFNENKTLEVTEIFIQQSKEYLKE